MHIPWDAVQLVLAIADAGSLSGAGRALRTTQPTVSRRLADLEAQLGEPLFVREVGGATLTSFGERLIEPARRMAEAGAEVERVASGAERGPRGVVRITAPPGIAATMLAPFAAALRAKLPEIRLEVVSTVRYVDLVRGEADLAIRLASAGRRDAPRDLITLAAVTHPVHAYAAPTYAASLPRGYGFPEVAWIGWPPPFEELAPNPQLAARIPGFRPVFAADDFLVQLRAAEAGLGAIILSTFRSRFEPPRLLVPLALDFGKLTSTHQLVCARGALAVPRVQAVSTLLATELAHTQPRTRPRRS
ncbi:MAG: LysR family transcriptional regulator [Kofleriaceae bacterium]